MFNVRRIQGFNVGSLDARLSHVMETSVSMAIADCYYIQTCPLVSLLISIYSSAFGCAAVANF